MEKAHLEASKSSKNLKQTADGGVRYFSVSSVFFSVFRDRLFWLSVSDCPPHFGVRLRVP